jgi:hypothetical protein
MKGSIEDAKTHTGFAGPVKKKKNKLKYIVALLYYSL